MHMKKLRQSASAQPDMTPRQGRQSDRGEFAWRSVRYLAVCAAGYLLGLSAGSVADGPGFWITAAVGLVALFLVFRSGKKSVSHAAADAVAAAIVDVNSRANATASQQVTVAGGHVVHGGPGAVAQPPVEAYERDLTEFPNPFHGARYLGQDDISGEAMYSVDGKFVRHTELVRRSQVDRSTASADADFWDPR